MFLNYKNSKILSEWINSMVNKGNIVFMTKITYKTTKKYLGLSDGSHVSYLPNFSSGDTSFSSVTIKKKMNEVQKSLELAWVGRIGDFKIHILNYSISSLNKLAEEMKILIRFHIIGSGEYESLLNLDYNNKYFEIVHLGELEKREVDIYLENNIHALFSMGTSALTFWIRLAIFLTRKLPGPRPEKTMQ